jgi:methanesulfonate monooxygenase large subunit
MQACIAAPVELARLLLEWLCVHKTIQKETYTMARDHNQWTGKPDLASNQFVDPRVYTDESIFREEQKNIFDKCWLIACHESELAAPLDYRTYQHPGGHNLIIIRDEDNKIHAFNNICPHRGNLLIYDAAGSI